MSGKKGNPGEFGCGNLANYTSLVLERTRGCYKRSAVTSYGMSRLRTICSICISESIEIEAGVLVNLKSKVSLYLLLLAENPVYGYHDQCPQHNIKLVFVMRFSPPNSSQSVSQRLHSFLCHPCLKVKDYDPYTLLCHILCEPYTLLKNL